MKFMKILVLRLDRLGDLVLSLPAINSLRENFPEARISVMVKKEFKELIEGNASINEVIEFDPSGIHKGGLEKVKLAWEVRKKGFDLAIDLAPVRNDFSALVLLLSGARERVGYNVGLRRIGANRKMDFPKEIKYEVELTLDLLRKIGLKKINKELRIDVKKDNKKKINNLLKNLNLEKKLLIGMHPGVSGDIPEKAWKKERYAELGKKLMNELNATIILTGNRKEKGLLGEINELMERKAYYFSELNAGELAALIGEVNLYITNNSGPMHIAVALKKPTIVINAFSNTNRWGPKGENCTVLKKGLPCWPCETGKPINCKRNFECINSIKVEHVFNAVKKQLNLN
ncbi:MAG: glycosyltransferase family 9 protein [archaeon]